MKSIVRRITQIVLTIGIVLLSSSSYAQPNFDWVGHNEGIVTVESMTTDINGNTLLVGTFQNTVDFDPGLGTQSIASVGSNDIFVQKIDINGNLLWVHTFGSSSTDEGQDIKVDTAGNVYVTGNFRNIIDFDPGPGNASFGSFGNDDVFVLKLDPNGNYVWVKTIGSIDEEESYTVAVDDFGNVYASGVITSSAVDMDPGPGVFTLTPSGTISSFVVKFKPNGDFIWAKQFRGSSSVFPEDIAIDNNNELLWTGHFQNSVDFDPNAGVTNLSSNGLRDIPIVKLDTAGSLVWARNIGGTSSDEGHSIMANSNNDVLLCGQFRNTVDFDPGVGVTNLVSGGSEDWFVLKLTSTGNYSWAISGGLNGSDESYGLDIDNNDNVYIAGKFSGNVDFNPQAGAFLINSNGGNDGFVQILDNNGFFVGAFSIDGTGIENSKDISIGSFNSIHVSGRFGSVTDFDPGVGTVNLTPVGTADGYILRLNQCSNTTQTINPSACTSYTSPSGKIFTTSNTYLDTIMNAEGCDSIITINLTINNASNGTDIQVACGSYTWPLNSTTYNSTTNTPTHTIVNGAANGCDSIVTLNLTINNSTNGTDVQVACGSYTWPLNSTTYTNSTTMPTYTIVGGNSNGCDSIVTLNLTINNTATGTDIITACNSYTWIDNNTYTTNNNNVTHTIVNGASNGCDSIVTLDLTINTVDNTTSTQGVDSISSNAVGATYRWLDCDNNYAVIGGATSQLFVASSNGNYAVEVTQNGCTDTSACVSITSVGIGELSNQELITIYPNPTNGLITIYYNDNSSNTANLSVVNVTGKIIGQWKVSSNDKLILDLSNEVKGMYFLEFRTESGKQIKKLLLQ